MRYVGIDIAKKDHQIAAVDEFGNVILKSFSAGNNESGFAKIAEKLEAARIESDECLVGMEATGHYWISLWEFLDANGYEVVVINPIQTDAFRKVDSLRKRKPTPSTACSSPSTCALRTPSRPRWPIRTSSNSANWHASGAFS